MDETQAIACLTALAQPTRMAAFRHLVAAHPDGCAAGEVARLCGVPHNTMSTHLAVLSRAGLIGTTRRGRSTACRADLQMLRGVILFLTRDCCQGRPEVCAPLLADLACCGAAANTDLGHA
jgi:ArsR family transcriptional regulator